MDSFREARKGEVPPQSNLRGNIMPEQPYTRQLAEFVFNLRYDTLPEDVIHRAKQCLIDYLGCAILGHTYPHAPKLVSTIRELKGGEQAAIIGFGDRTTVTYAALVNGAMGSTQLDDTCLASLGHPAVGVMPSVLSVGEWKHKSGRDAITAIVTGYELAMRVGAAIGAETFKRGWHPRGGVNVFGSAAAASILLNPTSIDEVCHSLSLGGTQASGLNEASFFYDGWHLLSGSAAQDGVLAAILAHAGYTAGCTILEGPQGYVQAVSPKSDLSQLNKELGEKFSIMNVAMKSYPSSHLIHAAIEAAVDLSKRHSIDSAHLDRIEVGVVNIDYLLDKTFPKDFFAASMNIPFLIAFSLRYGQGPRQIKPENLEDTLLKEVFRRVDVYVDKEMESQRPKYLGSVVRVRARDGKTFEEKVLTPKGDPDNPFTDDDIREKFESLTSGLISAEKQKALWSKVMRLEQEQDIGTLLPLTCR
jgi:2-methylcitrate dehydratase PrpD